MKRQIYTEEEKIKQIRLKKEKQEKCNSKFNSLGLFHALFLKKYIVHAPHCNVVIIIIIIIIIYKVLYGVTY